MAARRYKTAGFAVCLRNGEYKAGLEVRKLYPVLHDADAEAEGFIRVVDESGDDYLYPAEFFERVSLPLSLERTLRRAS